MRQPLCLHWHLVSTGGFSFEPSGFSFEPECFGFEPGKAVAKRAEVAKRSSVLVVKSLVCIVS